MQESLHKGVVKIGVVAYAPKVVTIWEGIKDYLRGQGLNADYVLYSNYPALVEALVAGHVDITWNTPLAYFQAKEKLGGQCQVLAMRDTDVDFTSVFITRADSPIRSLSDLQGKRFALAERFVQVILAMDYQNPEHKKIMDLEGLTRWVPGRTEGYRELEEAAREFDMLS